MKKFLKQLRKDERGLTLVELLAVVVILGIIATIAFVSIGNVIENSKKDAHIANAQQLISAAKLAEASEGWPEGEGSGYTTADVTEAASVHKELDTIEGLVNPWGEDPTYNGIVTKNGDDEYQVNITGAGISKDIDFDEGEFVVESIINQGRDAVEDELAK